MSKINQKTCEHRRFLRDRFSEIPGVRRAAPGRHICADCGALAEEVKRGEFVIWLPEEGESHVQA